MISEIDTSSVVDETEGVELVRLLAETVFSSGDIPNDWEESFILNLYKGKGEALDRGNYRGHKLTDQVMKLLERMLDSFIRNMVDIDEMQFGFVPGRGTTDISKLHCSPTAREVHRSQEASLLRDCRY